MLGLVVTRASWRGDSSRTAADQLRERPNLLQRPCVFHPDRGLRTRHHQVVARFVNSAGELCGYSPLSKQNVAHGSSQMRRRSSMGPPSHAASFRAIFRRSGAAGDEIPDCGGSRSQPALKSLRPERLDAGAQVVNRAGQPSAMPSIDCHCSTFACQYDLSTRRTA